MASAAIIKGRGAAENPMGRFEKLDYTPDPQEAQSGPQTIYYRDDTRNILAKNNSPDIPFNVSINPYRGCEHGCIYCYARPTHEYLGLSAGLDFESRIFVKENAPQLLHKALMAPRWQPQTIGISGVTDPYQPAESHFKLTRECLNVLKSFRNPVGLITKSHLVTRDIDILRQMATYNGASVAISITTLDNTLHQRMEPRAATPQRRLAAIRKLRAAGIPVMVMVAPIIPGLTDHEIPDIIAAAADAGALNAAYIILRLPHGLTDLFQNWLERHYPDRKNKVINRLKAMRDGKLNNPDFFDRMRGEGIYARQISGLFNNAIRKAGFRPYTALSNESFRRPGPQQMKLFNF